MIDAFTCPHCDAALELPAAAPMQAVRCPCCRGLLPNPHPVGEDSAVAGQPLLARAVDDDAAALVDRRAVAWVAVLGFCGTAVAAMLVGIAMETFAVGTRVSAKLGWGMTWTAMLVLFCGAFFLAQQQRPLSLIGWIVLATFATLGGCSLATAVVALGWVLLFAPRAS